MSHFRSDRPRARDCPSATDHARQEGLPTFGGLMGKDDATDTILAEYAPTLSKRPRHSRFEEYGRPLGGR